MSKGEWSLKAGVFLELMMDTLQQADEMGGLEDSEYVRAMFYLSNQCSERAMKCLKRMVEEVENE